MNPSLFLSSVVALALLTAPSFCNENRLIASEEGSSYPQSSGLKGVFLTGDKEAILFEGKPGVEGIQIQDLDLPGNADALKKRIQPFLGRMITKEMLLEIKKEIILFYRDNKRPGIVVEVPKQKTESGVMQFLISEKVLGKVTYEGSKWWSEEKIKHILNFKEGSPIDQDQMQNSLAWLNQNPFHHSKIEYTPAEDTNAVDAVVKTQDRFPIRFYAKGDNSGNPQTGNDRITGGATWGNAFFINDLLTYQYTTSNFTHRYMSHTGNYLSFLPWKHTVSFFGNHTTVKPFIPNFGVTAMSNEGSFRYNIPFKPLYEALQQWLSFGFDLKFSNSNIINLTSSTPSVQPVRPISQKINVSELVGVYTLQNKTGKHLYFLDFQVYWSPFHFMKHQSDHDFQVNRPYSQNEFIYAYLTLGDTYELPKKFSLAGMLRVQRANKTLPSTDLFSIGGYDTVRGYHQSEFLSDNGVIINVELRSPTLSPMQYFGKKTKDQLTLLGFVDYGVANNFHALPNLPNTPKNKATQYALGAGPGLRYFINPYFSLRCDYGFKLHRLYSANAPQHTLHKGFGEWHFGAMLSY